MLEVRTLHHWQTRHLLSATVSWPGCGHLSPEMSSVCAAAREWSALSGVGTTSQSWPTYLGHRGDDLRYWTKLVQVQGGRAAGPLHWLVLSLHTIEIVLCGPQAHTSSLAPETVLVGLNLAFSLLLPTPSCPWVVLSSESIPAHHKAVANAHPLP